MAEEKVEPNVGELGALLNAREASEPLFLPDQCLECSFGHVPEYNFVVEGRVLGECNFTDIREADADVAKHVRELVTEYRNANPASTMIISTTDKVIANTEQEEKGYFIAINTARPGETVSIAYIPSK